MTSQEKARLLEMRQAGASFTQIAAELHISKNTLKSFYRRMDGGAEAGSSVQCIRCGKHIAPGAKRRYCSDGCRYAWCYAHRVLNVDNAVKKKCACCERPFFSYPSGHRKYCSRACYIADRYGKEAGVYAQDPC